MKTLLMFARAFATVSFAALSALHMLWATGSAWPARDRSTLADAVGGFTEFPGAGACLAVAALLGLAAVCVGGLPRPLTRLTRFGSAAAAAVLAIRGSVGIARMMPNARRSPVFAELDRRFYSPICLILAVVAMTGTMPGSSK